MIEFFYDIKKVIALLLFALFGYIITQSYIFVYFGFIVLLLSIISEIKRANQSKQYFKELSIFVLGLVIVMQIVGIILDTGTISIFNIDFYRPILNVIPSCSMEPNYRRGDLILIGFRNDINVKTYNAKFNSTPVLIFNGKYYENESVLKCNNLCYEIRMYPELFEEKYGDLYIKYGKCERSNGMESYYVVCAKQYKIGNGEYQNITDEGEVVIYKPYQTDFFGRFGMIIHRALFKICDGECFYFTKGDNNEFFDFQYGNRPFDHSRIIGRPIIKIPYIGYIRIFLTPWDLYKDKVCEYVLRPGFEPGSLA
jgi:signal peptidase I